MAGEGQAMTSERMRQALDESMLTHTGRSIGDVASQRVMDDLWPLIEAREMERQRAAPTQSYYQMLEQRLSDKGDEVERLRAERAELEEKLDAETDYSAGRIESLLKRCAGLRHRAHMAEQQREQAMTVVRAVADTGADFDMNTGNSWLLFPGLYAAEQCREQARALLASAGDSERSGGDGG